MKAGHKLILMALLLLAILVTMPGSLLMAQAIPDSQLTINMTSTNASSYLVMGQGSVGNSSLRINTALVEIALVGVRMYPLSCDFGLIRPGDVKSTGIAFEILNATNLTMDVAIAVQGDWSGTVNWTHSDDCTPGVDIAGMVAVIQGASSHTAVVVRKTAPYNNIVTALAPGQTCAFGLQLYAPTSFTDLSRKGNSIFISTEES